MDTTCPPPSHSGGPLPEKPDISIETEKVGPEEATVQILNKIIKRR